MTLHSLISKGWMPEFDSQQWKVLFSLPLYPDCLWSPPNLLSSWYQELFPQCRNGCSM